MMLKNEVALWAEKGKSNGNNKNPLKAGVMKRGKNFIPAKIWKEVVLVETERRT